MGGIQHTELLPATEGYDSDDTVLRDVILHTPGKNTLLSVFSA